MKTCLVILISISLWNTSSGQTSGVDTSRHIASSTPFKGSRLDSIIMNLTDGRKDAFFQLAVYLDSSLVMTEWMGFEKYQEEEREIVQRIITANSFFLPNELDKQILNTASFLAFLKLNERKIVFDKDAGMYLITPLKERKIKVEIRRLSETRKKELNDEPQSLLTANGIKKDSIAALIKSHNPLALYEIALTLFAPRYSHDLPQLSEEQCSGLIELLTGTQINVEDNRHKLTSFIIHDYTNTAKFNLLAYFAGNYQNYKWSDELNRFVNTKQAEVTMDRKRCISTCSILKQIV